MISKEKFAYAPTYDLYIDRATMVVFKRKSRLRKTEIQEYELVPLRLRVMHNGYFTFQDSVHGGSRCVGIQYAYADAFPERVNGWEDHLADFVTYSELDHLHGHDTLESNFPENLRWTSVRVNRARTSQLIDVTTLDEKERAHILKRREYERERRKDPEITKKRRIQQAEYRRRKYAENKDIRKQQTEALNAEIARRAAKKN